MGVLLGIYAAVMLGVSAFSDPDKLGSALASVIFGVTVAAFFLVVMVKFGWTMPILRSRDEIAAARAQRAAMKAQARGVDVEQVPGPRSRPAPTRRTSTGPSQNPRRSSSARKR